MHSAVLTVEFSVQLFPSGATAGVLSGVPTTAGKVDVSIRSELTYINGYNAKGTPWDKARPPYARSCDLNFTITVS